MKRVLYLIVAGLLVMGLVLAGCPSDNGNDEPQTVSIAAIPGVTAPAIGATPKTTITETAQYTGSIAWLPAHGTFEPETVYTATITLSAKTGYTFDGVGANFFTVAGATATNAADSGVVEAVFPATPAPAIPPEPTKIVIGMSKSETGGQAAIHAAAALPILLTHPVFKPVAEGGGVYLSAYDKTVPVEYLIYDDGSDVATMLENTEKLITVDKVDFLFGPTGTHMIAAQAAVADAYGMVLMTMEGGATHIKQDALPDLPYLFVTLSFSNWYQVPVLADILAAEGAETAFIAYVEDEHGLEYKEVAEEEFARVGISIVGTPFPMGYDFTDFDAVIAAAQASGADVFCAFSYPDQNLPLVGIAKALNYNPNAMIFGPGANFGFFPFFAELTPADIEGVMCYAIANRATSQAMADMFDAIEATMDVVMAPAGMPGSWFLDWWGHPLYWAMVDIWKEAVEAVGYVDQDLLRAELASRGPANPFTTVLGPTWYTMFPPGGGILAYESHPGEIGQWQGGIVEIVGGEQTTADFVYPKPAW